MGKAKNLVIILLIMSMSIVFSTSTFDVSADGVPAFGAATVNAQGLRLRSGPSTSYSILLHLGLGDVVVILERTNSEWYKVNFHGHVGYLSVPLLRDVLVAESFSAQGRVTAGRVHIRASPNASGDVLGTYRQRTEMRIIGINSGWYKINHDGNTGYVRSDLMEIVAPPSAHGRPPRPAPDPNLPLGRQVVEFALGYIGYRYVWGGASPAGFDCSGYVTYVLRNFGIYVSRTASAQYRNNGVPVDRSEIAPGDLIFFSSDRDSGITHVGIYIGENEFVHASRSGVGVIVSRLDSSYYTRNWYGAKRVIL